MIEHHIQRKIISDLVESESLTYSRLKPANIEGNVFTYHLNNLIKQKLITKDKGEYTLTNNGKLYGINGAVRPQNLLAQAHSIILLSIRDGDRWLVRKRLVQPLFGRVGFMHGEPEAGETISQAGDRILRYRTGLKGDMSVKGSGYVQIEDENGLVAYSHFTMLEVTNTSGVLQEKDNHGENLWLTRPDFNSVEMIPSMPDLARELQKPGLFFMDKKYTI